MGLAGGALSISSFAGPPPPSSVFLPTPGISLLLVFSPLLAGRGLTLENLPLFWFVGISGLFRVGNAQLSAWMSLLQLVQNRTSTL